MSFLSFDGFGKGFMGRRMVIESYVVQNANPKEAMEGTIDRDEKFKERILESFMMF